MIELLIAGFFLPPPSHTPLGAKDLLMDEFEPDDGDKDDLELLNEILNAPPANDDFSKEWSAVFGDTPLNPTANYTNPAEREKPKEGAQFMPSNLLDLNQQIAAINLGQSKAQAFV